MWLYYIYVLGVDFCYFRSLLMTFSFTVDVSFTMIELILGCHLCACSLRKEDLGFVNGANRKQVYTGCEHLRSVEPYLMSNIWIEDLAPQVSGARLF